MLDERNPGNNKPFGTNEEPLVNPLPSNTLPRHTPSGPPLIEPSLNGGLPSVPRMGISKDLPIVPYLDSILHAVEHHDVVVISAETGAGKSSGVPELLAQAGYRVICTQPTRIAAEALQRQVETQVGGTGGEQVGFKHGRGSLIGDDFSIMFCSDGLLYEKITLEQYFKKVGLLKGDQKQDILVVDEAHIFNRNIEHNLALWQKYRSCKLVVMSATINTDQIVSFLRPKSSESSDDNIKVFQIPGRQHNIRELTKGQELLDDIIELLEAKYGDIMVFLPGAGEIERLREDLLKLKLKADIVPLHGKLSLEEQNRALTPTSNRPRIILATNISETSLTVSGVSVVIDMGTQRILTCDGDEETLALVNISKATYNQRRGRCGRQGTGYHINWGLPETALCDGHWEMAHAPLHGHFLRSLAAGEDPLRLNFLHDPGEAKRLATIEWLKKHEFIAEDRTLTELGYLAARLPLEPREAKIIQYALAHRKEHPELMGCLIDVAAVASVRDFRNHEAASLFQLIDKNLHPLVRNSENLAHMLALEAIYREKNGARRQELLKRFGIRSEAAQDVCFQRQDIADRLGISIAALGTRDLSNLPTEAALEGTASNWSDRIYQLVGYDRHDNPMYVDIRSPSLSTYKLGYHARLVGTPLLVTGKPFGIGMRVESEDPRDVLRIITKICQIPQEWYRSQPALLKHKLQAQAVQSHTVGELFSQVGTKQSRSGDRSARGSRDGSRSRSKGRSNHNFRKPPRINKRGRRR